MNFQNCHFSYDTRRAQRWRYSEEIDFKKVDPIVCESIVGVHWRGVQVYLPNGFTKYPRVESVQTVNNF